MIGVWMTPSQNGQCELSVRRDGINKIVIWTHTPLTDAQAEELFWCVGTMQKSGKTLKDLLKEQDAVKPTKANNPDESEYCCGICGYPLWLDEFYCAHCGRRIEWEGR